MPLLSRTGAGGARHAPAFSSMLLATTFFSRAQQLGHVVRLDYIFPADGRRVADDFPEYVIQLDPSPEAFFGSDSSVYAGTSSPAIRTLHRGHMSQFRHRPAMKIVTPS